jgi:SsrA-binding protein
VSPKSELKIIAKNRKALHEYFIEEKYEAGIVLRGSEVKALRLSNPSLQEAYAMVRNNEVWLVGMHITTVMHASYMNHTERRERKLLLSRKEIKSLDQATRQKGYTLVPLEIYFNADNRVKIEIGVAKGKAFHDKRQSKKEAEAKLEMSRALRKHK